AVALKSNGTVFSWGLNSYGQLGIGTIGGQRTTPVQTTGFPAGTVIVAIAPRDYHTLPPAPHREGYAWGLGQYGQLGNGVATNRATPLAVSISGARAVAAGASHSLVTLADGSLWTFGYNANGQLGTGDTASQLSPRRLAGPSGVIAI